jgi:hypothetical protein
MLRTVLAKNLKPGMIIKCGFMVLTINKGITVWFLMEYEIQKKYILKWEVRQTI